MYAQPILPGFTDLVHDAGHCFRALLEAMSHPGKTLSVTGPDRVPDGLSHAAAAVALTLFDNDTPVRLEGVGQAVAPWLQFHCGCSVTADAAHAAFVIVQDGMALPDLRQYALGTEDYPDRSTTMIIQVASFSEGDVVRLEGPGIDGETRVRVAGLDRSFWETCSLNRCRYPQGLDVVLTSGAELVCLPRTVTARGPITCM